LKISRAGAEQHGHTAEQLPDCLAIIVLDVGALLRILYDHTQAISLTLWQPPPQPPGAKSDDGGHAGEQWAPPANQQRPPGQCGEVSPDANGEGGENGQQRDKDPYRVAYQWAASQDQQSGRDHRRRQAMNRAQAVRDGSGAGGVWR